MGANPSTDVASTAATATFVAISEEGESKRGGGGAGSMDQSASDANNNLRTLFLDVDYLRFTPIPCLVDTTNPTSYANLETPSCHAQHTPTLCCTPAKSPLPHVVHGGTSPQSPQVATVGWHKSLERNVLQQRRRPPAFSIRLIQHAEMARRSLDVLPRDRPCHSVFNHKYLTCCHCARLAIVSKAVASSAHP